MQQPAVGVAPPRSRGSPPPPSAAVPSDISPEDAVLDEPEQGRYSAGFLSPVIDRKMADLRTTTNSLFLGISSQRFKLVGDICLLTVAVLWLGTSVWDEFKGEDGDNEDACVNEAIENIGCDRYYGDTSDQI